MLVADKSNDEIVQYMVDRYGDFVLYEPRVDPQTYLLWFGPILLLLIAFFVVFIIVRMRSKRQSNNQLNSSQQEQLNSLLNKQQDN
jgi:cytochrome c-type biogenesis protein CcmH